MGLLDIFKKGKKENAIDHAPEAGRVSEPKKEENKETGKLLKKAIKKSDNKDKEDKKESSELIKASKKDTKNAYKVLLKPLVTEKATMTNTYLFEIDNRTNKQEVKKAVFAVYGVKPVKVNIINYGSRKVRWGRVNGSTKAWKKAVVYLKEGDKIDIYEGV